MKLKRIAAGCLILAASISLCACEEKQSSESSFMDTLKTANDAILEIREFVGNDDREEDEAAEHEDETTETAEETTGTAGETNVSAKESAEDTTEAAAETKENENVETITPWDADAESVSMLTAAETEKPTEPERAETAETSAAAEAAASEPATGAWYNPDLMHPSDDPNNMIFGTWEVVTSNWTDETNAKYNVQWSPYLVFCEDGTMAYSFQEEVDRGIYLVNVDNDGTPFAVAMLDDVEHVITIYHGIMEITNMPEITEKGIDGKEIKTTTWGFSKLNDDTEWIQAAE